MCNVLGAEDMFGEDPADVFLYFCLSIFCPFLLFFLQWHVQCHGMENMFGEDPPTGYIGPVALVRC